MNISCRIANADTQCGRITNPPERESITTYDFYMEKLNYIHMNPVRQEFVDKPEDYLYSSARDYCGGKGLIDVTVTI